MKEWKMGKKREGERKGGKQERMELRTLNILVFNYWYLIHANLFFKIIAYKFKKSFCHFCIF